jgi:hypothetical protein
MFEMTTEKVFHADGKFQKKGKILQIPLRQGSVHEAKKRQDLYVLNWKSS